jgi:hypothetical protein
VSSFCSEVIFPPRRSPHQLISKVNGMFIAGQEVLSPHYHSALHQLMMCSRYCPRVRARWLRWDLYIYPMPPRNMDDIPRYLRYLSGRPNLDAVHTSYRHEMPPSTTTRNIVHTVHTVHTHGACNKQQTDPWVSPFAPAKGVILATLSQSLPLSRSSS